MISIEPSPDDSDLQLDLGILADQAIPVGVCNQVREQGCRRVAFSKKKKKKNN